jgi:hypothetical protein
LALLLRHSEDPYAAQLAVLYVEATRPLLDSTEKMSMYMNALIRTDLDAAFKYQVGPLKPSIDGSVPLLKLFEEIYSRI